MGLSYKRIAIRDAEILSLRRRGYTLKEIRSNLTGVFKGLSISRIAQICARKSN